MTEGTTYQIRVDTGTAGMRLDVLLPRFVPDFSRTRGQQLITAGLVTVNGAVSSKRYAVHAGDRIEVVVPPPAPAKPLAEEIPLEILHEDASLVAVNKPAGMVVHPAPGHAGGTLVNALLAAVPTLSGIGGEVRPGIVHRLDKGTSGVVLVAKNDRAHRALAAQFAARQVAKTYLALAWGVLPEDEGCWDTAIGRDAKDRQKISPRTRRPRPAVTRWRVLRHFPDATLLELHPETGRTHQLRVHLADAHHPILGDPVYGPRGGRESVYRRASVARGFRDRLALHAWKIAFAHPTRRSRVEIVASPPPELARLLEGGPETARKSWRGGAQGKTSAVGSVRRAPMEGCSDSAPEPARRRGAEGWREGEASAARTAGSTVEVRSDRTPQPARKWRARS